MEKVNSKLDEVLEWMIYGSLLVLAIGLLTSPTILALSHILMILPALYFIPRTNYSSWPKSAWALLAMNIVIILSVLVNQDIAVRGYVPIAKAKYFIFGFVSLGPLAWVFKNHFNEKKISYILYALCLGTTLATVYGILKIKFGHSLIFIGAPTNDTRVGGFFGMLMNYAHNMSYFLIILLGVIIYREKCKRYINMNFVYAVFIINLAGLYLSYTRGAWLGFLFAIPFYFFKNHKKWFVAAVGGIIVFGAIVYFAAGQAMHRKDYDATRLGQWQAAIAAFKERPVFGYGYLNFEKHSVNIKQRYHFLVPDFKGHAHNNVFEMLGSTGLLGVTTFILWLVLWFKELYNRSDVLAQIGLPFIVTFFIGGLTQSTISLGINLFFIIAAYSISSFVQVKTKEISNS
nr:O-antigen ligase family protein [Bacteriovorax sp. HI3]